MVRLSAGSSIMREMSSLWGVGAGSSLALASRDRSARLSITTRFTGPRARRLILFGIAGVAATSTDFGIFNLGIAFMTEPSRTSLVALNTLAFACATAVSFTLNARFTFSFAEYYDPQ